MSLSRVIRAEIISAGAISVGEKLIIKVDPNLKERRIYLFQDSVSSGDFVMYGRVDCINANGPGIVADFEANLCSFALGQLPQKKSIGNNFAAGGSAVGDSYVLDLAEPFNANLPQVIMQPLRINVGITHISYTIASFAGQITGHRAWLGCLSTEF